MLTLPSPATARWMMRDFLEFVQGTDEGLVEIRAIRNGHASQWWEKDRQEAVDLAISLSDSGWDAYYGVLPRVSKAGDASHVSDTVHTLWADLDAKTIGSKHMALFSLTRFMLPPNVVVDSGHGYHAYWRMREPVPYDMARLAMIGLERQLRGDAVHDKPRILRIPGTTNWKDPLDPKPVRAIVFDTTNLLRFEDFHAQVELGYGVEHPQPVTRQRTHDEGLRSGRMPHWLGDLIRDGVPQGQRSEAAWKVMCYLIELGWSDADIRSAFDNGAIGDKMREQRDGDRWFERSLTRARAVAR